MGRVVALAGSWRRAVEDLDGLAHQERWHSDADYDTSLADLYATRRIDAY
jgi:hypothetical protein